MGHRQNPTWVRRAFMVWSIDHRLTIDRPSVKVAAVYRDAGPPRGFAAPVFGPSSARLRPGVLKGYYSEEPAVTSSALGINRWATAATITGIAMAMPSASGSH